MRVSQFEKQIKHLDQVQILSGAVNVLNKLLVDKGVVSAPELQKYFEDWMREKKLTKRRSKNGKST